MIGKKIYDLVEKLFPINRSITGDGVRETLTIIKELIPIKIHEIPSGTQIYDWSVPEEWNVRGAYIKDSAGSKIVDFKDNNLHLVGYSEPVDQYFDLDELQEHLHSIPEKPDAIPYRISYYKRNWGFCMEHGKREKLKQDKYHVLIDSELKCGSMTYADLIIKGESDKEVLISTYICHPSMANNELSGPCLAVYLARYLMERPLKYTYRFIFVPETIGAMVYMFKNPKVKDLTIAGFNVSCVGDPNKFSYVPTRYGNTFSDKVAKNILKFSKEGYKEYSFLDRGSNEKILCAPGFDLPIANVNRSKFSAFEEYHTSLDNLSFITEDALHGSFEIYCKLLKAIEKNEVYTFQFPGEPFLSKRDLYSQKHSDFLSRETQMMKDILAYADGTNDLIDISNIINEPLEKIYTIIDILLEHDLITKIGSGETCHTRI